MKTSTNIFLKAAALAVAVLPMLTSCYDDSSIWDKFDDIENRLEELETSLNEQFQALNSILDGKTTVTECKQNADGSYDVTLSNGTRFTVLPAGTDYSSLVGVITVNGVKCWATYDANGKLIALTDDAGQPVPVIKESEKTQVEVVSEDGKFYLVIDGNRYLTGYDTEDLVQVFSSCTPLEDASGNVYAMQFTFGEDMTVTVTLDGYNGVIFKLANALNSSVVTEYFVAMGETQTVLLEKAGVVDYIMQIPDGWRVDERVDEYTGETYIDITAPTAAAVAAGAAVEGGDLKVVAVVEGGKAAVSKLALSSEPFKVFDVNGSKAVIEPYNGVQKYVYGVTLKSEYDEAALLAKVNELLKATGDMPAGFCAADGPVTADHADTFGGVLGNNVEYVFWAIPALYTEEGNGGFHVNEGSFVTHTFSNTTVKFVKTVPSLFDADIEVTFNGVSKIYGGTVAKTSDAVSEIVRLVNSGVFTAVNVSESYKGTASAFPTAEANTDVDFVPGTAYLTWIVPAQDGKTNYTVNDVITNEFTTNAITSGSSLKVTFGEAVTDMTSISIPVSSEGAEMLYYVYMTKSDGDRIASLDNNTLAELILDDEDCVAVKGSSVTAKAENVSPKTTMWLYAVAVDKNGKYGEVKSVSATTGELTFNSLTVTATDTEVGAENASFKIEVTGGEATEYIYWFGKDNDDFWLNMKYLGGSVTTAQQYLALYSQDSNISKSMAKFGPINNGVLHVSGLTTSTNYVLVVIAKDASGLWSKAGYKMITTLAANLGNIVREGSAAWNTAKENVKVDWIKERFFKGSSMGYASYAFNFSCPTDLTAFVLCGSDEYFTDPQFQDVEARIIEIEKEAGRKTTSSPAIITENGDFLCEPDWLDSEGNVNGGTMAIIADYYVHGNPASGRFAYMAPGTCNEDCPNYSESMKSIEERLNIDWYKTKFAGYYAMNNDEAAIEKAAQELLEFYLPYYQDKEPIIFENDGSPIEVNQPYGIGTDQTGNIIDDVFVVLKDKDGNYYEPMKFEVPAYFK